MREVFTEEQLRLIDRDMLDFTRGKRKLIHVKRWVTTQHDEISMEKAADLLAAKFRALLIDGWTAL